MKKSAFTMLELIIVIVVVGILAAVVIPRLERDTLRETADQVVRHIQFTQHLAMVNDVYDSANPWWFQNRWSIDLCQTAYIVQRVNGSEIAEDTLTQREIDGTDNDIADKNVAMVLTGTASDCKIIFDNMGRPYRMAGAPATPNVGLTLTDMDVLLNSNGRTAIIRINKETGYIQLLPF